MKKNYKVNDIFNESGSTLDDLICKIFTSFLDRNLKLFELDK